MCCFLIISLFAGWRYAGRIFNAVSAREGDLRVPQPERPPSRSHPVGHGKSVTSSMCNTVDFCLYAAVLRMERCADLVSVFFGTYSGTLGRSGPCILRYLWWYAEPGCCGGGVITAWAAGDGVIAAGSAV